MDIFEHKILIVWNSEVCPGIPQGCGRSSAGVISAPWVINCQCETVALLNPVKDVHAKNRENYRALSESPPDHMQKTTVVSDYQVCEPKQPDGCVGKHKPVWMCFLLRDWGSSLAFILGPAVNIIHAYTRGWKNSDHDFWCIGIARSWCGVSRNGICNNWWIGPRNGWALYFKPFIVLDVSRVPLVDVVTPGKEPDWEEAPNIV